MSVALIVEACCMAHPCRRMQLTRWHGLVHSLSSMSVRMAPRCLQVQCTPSEPFRMSEAPIGLPAVSPAAQQQQQLGSCMS